MYLGVSPVVCAHMCFAVAMGSVAVLRCRGASVEVASACFLQGIAFVATLLAQVCLPVNTHMCVAKASDLWLGFLLRWLCVWRYAHTTNQLQQPATAQIRGDEVFGGARRLRRR